MLSVSVPVNCQMRVSNMSFILKYVRVDQVLHSIVFELKSPSLKKRCFNKHLKVIFYVCVFKRLVDLFNHFIYCVLVT